MLIFVLQKHSHIPKDVGKFGQKKYKGMKGRLQLKVKVNEPELHEDQEVENQYVVEEEPLASKPPKREQVPTADEDDTGTVKPMDGKKNKV